MVSKPPLVQFQEAPLTSWPWKWLELSWSYASEDIVYVVYNISGISWNPISLWLGIEAASWPEQPILSESSPLQEQLCFKSEGSEFKKTEVLCHNIIALF